MIHLNFSYLIEYKGFSSKLCFSQLTSELQQEAGGFPTGLVSLQYELKLCIQKCIETSLSVLSVLQKLGLGPLASLLKVSFLCSHLELFEKKAFFRESVEKKILF